MEDIIKNITKIDGLQQLTDEYFESQGVPQNERVYSTGNSIYLCIESEDKEYNVNDKLADFQREAIDTTHFTKKDDIYFQVYILQDSKNDKYCVLSKPSQLKYNRGALLLQEFSSYDEANTFYKDLIDKIAKQDTYQVKIVKSSNK